MALFLFGVLLIYHLRFSWWGLTAGFTFDDLMNLGRAIQFGWPETLFDVAFFAKPTHLYRPAGALFYLAIDAFSGPDPLAYRVACHALMAVNAVLAFGFFRLLSGRLAVAAIAVIPVVHHPSRQLFYVNSGYCYDLLCFFFTLAALSVYVEQRGHGRELSDGKLALVLVFLVLALGSKEVGGALPLALLAFEAATPGRWSWRRAFPVLATGGVVAAFIIGRVLADSGLASIESYTPSLAAPALLKRALAFFRECSMLPGWGGIALTVLSVLPRDRVSATALGLGLAAFLPVAALDRSFEASYLAAAAWSLATANMLIWATGLVGHWTGRSAPLLAVFTFILTINWFWSQSAQRALDPRNALAEGRRIQQTMDGIRSLQLDLPPPVRVLFLEDPFPESRFASTFLLTILHGGRGGPQEVVNVDWAGEGKQDDPAVYAAVLTMKDGRLVRIR